MYHIFITNGEGRIKFFCGFTDVLYKPSFRYSIWDSECFDNLILCLAVAKDLKEKYGYQCIILNVVCNSV